MLLGVGGEICNVVGGELCDVADGERPHPYVPAFQLFITFRSGLRCCLT